MPVLYSISRDGAVHGYSYIRDGPDRSQSAAASTDLSSEEPAGTVCAYTGKAPLAPGIHVLMSRIP